MQNLGFIIAGYAVIVGGAALYAGLLLRRLSSARRESLRIRREAESAELPRPDRSA
jgi:hypothetical protein